MHRARIGPAAIRAGAWRFIFSRGQFVQRLAAAARHATIRLARNLATRRAPGFQTPLIPDAGEGAVLKDTPSYYLNKI